MAARLRRDITQRTVAKAVGLTSAAISRYESGEVIPNDEIMGRIAKFFGVRPSWLRYGEGDKAAPKSGAIEAPAQTAGRRRRGGGGST